MKAVVARALRVFALFGLALMTLVAAAAQAGEAPVPKRDLTVELRQIEDGREEGVHYSAGSPDHSAWEAQMVQVRNGEKALLRMNDAIPMQWTQAVSGPDPGAFGAGATNAASRGNQPAGNKVPGNAHGDAASGVANALVWFDAGQSISVRPKWPGGHQPAVVEIEVQRAAVDPRVGTDLPRQTRNTVSTTLTLPLAQWVTFAATGRAAGAASYSSESALPLRRLLQIRVMAPASN
jgi:hypothetical protein